MDLVNILIFIFSFLLHVFFFENIIQYIYLLFYDKDINLAFEIFFFLMADPSTRVIVIKGQTGPQGEDGPPGPPGPPGTSGSPGPIAPILVNFSYAGDPTAVPENVITLGRTFGALPGSAGFDSLDVSNALYYRIPFPGTITNLTVHISGNAGAVPIGSYTVDLVSASTVPLVFGLVQSVLVDLPQNIGDVTSTISTPLEVELTEGTYIALQVTLPVAPLLNPLNITAALSLSPPPL